jgi:hypothetical protein
MLTGQSGRILPEVSGSAETKRACGFAADWRAWKTRNRS